MMKSTASKSWCHILRGCLGVALIAMGAILFAGIVQIVSIVVGAVLLMSALSWACPCSKINTAQINCCLKK